MLKRPLSREAGNWEMAFQFHFPQTKPTIRNLMDLMTPQEPNDFSDPSDLTAEQRIQQRQYSIPYHHIPALTSSGFRQHCLLSWGYEYLSYMNFLIDKVTSLQPRQVLDVGCGDGRLLTELYRREIGSSWVGIDYSSQAIAFARAFCSEIEWHAARLEVAELPLASFDVISAVEVLEHIPPEEIPLLLARIRALLQPGGRLILTVPTDNRPVRAKHYQHFNRESLTDILLPHFEPVEWFFLNRNRSLFRTFLQLMTGNGSLLLINQRVMGWLYRHYCRHHLICREQDCRRLMAVCVVHSPTTSAGNDHT